MPLTFPDYHFLAIYEQCALFELKREDLSTRHF